MRNNLSLPDELAKRITHNGIQVIRVIDNKNLVF